MRAQLVTYNPIAQVFGYWRLDLTWLDSGVIRATASLLGLPAISYGESIRNLQVGCIRAGLEVLVPCPYHACGARTYCRHAL